MPFIARYIPITEGKAYYRTIYADSINEATTQANKWVKKGYQLSTVTEAR